MWIIWQTIISFCEQQSEFFGRDVYPSFVLILLEGGHCLEDIRHLKAKSNLLSVLEMKRRPKASHFKLVTFTSAQVGIIHPALTRDT